MIVFMLLVLALAVSMYAGGDIDGTSPRFGVPVVILAPLAIVAAVGFIVMTIRIMIRDRRS
jgi:hypothetical protein